MQQTTLRQRVLVAVAIALLAFGGSLSQAPSATAVDDPIAAAIAAKRALQDRIAKQQAAVKRLAEEQKQLKAQVKQTTDDLAAINIDLGAVRTDVATRTAELAAARQRHADLVREVAGLDATVEFLQDQADDLRDDLQERRRVLSAHLAEAYRVGQSSLLEQLLSSGSLLQGVVDQRSYMALGERDVELARSIEGDTVELIAQQRQVSHVRYRTERLRRDVERQAADLDLARDELLAAQAKLEKLEAETARLLEEERKHHQAVVRSKAQAKALLEKQTAAEKALTAKIRRLIEEERHRGRLPSKYNGTMRWPVKGTVTQEFGCTGFEWEPPLGDCEHFHKGIDLVGEKEGPAIHAAADGIILFAGFNPYDEAEDPAWIVIIAHSDDLRTWYGHLQPRPFKTIKAGAKIREGQVIGYMGNSGHSTGEHLHWAVEFKTEFMNPRLFL